EGVINMENKNLRKLTLKVEYQKGEDNNGNAVIKRQSFSRVNLEASSAGLKLFADKVSEIINYPVTYVGTSEEYGL
ncbi:DUF1659 domain-containing protein, partial [Cetobacterium sp.]|uniref:DUF1659 domain-containing protein n=1 Tax=Cetobacterium sp. TaxID=2071632 RepID=UPI003F2ABD4C